MLPVFRVAEPLVIVISPAAVETTIVIIVVVSATSVEAAIIIVTVAIPNTLIVVRCGRFRS